MGLYSIKTRVAYLIWAFLMVIVGIPGNFLIIWTILRNKNLRNMHNIPIVLLAVIDSLLIGYLLPINIFVLITNEEPTRTACKINGIMADSLFTWSIEFIMLIALSRYVKICRRRQFDKIFKKETVIAAILLFFIIAFSFNFPLWFFDHLLVFDRTIHYCGFDRYGDKLYSFIYITICLVSPITVTSFCYVKIYLHVRKSQNQLYKHWNNGLARRQIRYDILSLKPQFVVFVAYLVLYFPFALTSVVGNANTDYPEDFHSVGIYMCFLSSCINIFIYGVMNKNMRKAFIDSILCDRKTLNNQINPMSAPNSNKIKKVPTVTSLAFITGESIILKSPTDGPTKSVTSETMIKYESRTKMTNSPDCDQQDQLIFLQKSHFHKHCEITPSGISESCEKEREKEIIGVADGKNTLSPM